MFLLLFVYSSEMLWVFIFMNLVLRCVVELFVVWCVHVCDCVLVDGGGLVIVYEVVFFGGVGGDVLEGGGVLVCVL